MKLFNLTYLFALLATISFYSCKDEIHPNEESDLSATLTDVAHFSSQEQFDNSITAYKNNGIFPSELNGINSLAQSETLKSATFEDGYEDEDSLICSDLFREFLNDRYEIIIGDVFIRITEQGTFFTNVENAIWLRNLEISDETIEDVGLVTNALGYDYESGMYSVNKYENLFVYDTFRKIDPIKDEIVNINIDVLKSTTLPSDSEWKDIDDGGTLVGKAWDSIWGFSKSVRNYFDSKHRVDVKFYAQRFLGYSEMGIKTKTQYKGWTGIWRKQDCDEIINGWEILNLKEQWPEDYFGPDFDPNKNFLPNFSFQNQAAMDLAYSISLFGKEEWKTFNIMGLDIEFSQKDKLGMLWKASKTAGRVTTDYINNELLNRNNNREAIRLSPRVSDVRTTKATLAPYCKRSNNTDKYTYIIASSSGLVVGSKYQSGSFSLPSFKNLSAKYEFLENSILYGAARRGSSWRGVRITFK